MNRVCLLPVADCCDFIIFCSSSCLLQHEPTNLSWTFELPIGSYIFQSQISLYSRQFPTRKKWCQMTLRFFLTVPNCKPVLFSDSPAYLERKHKPGNWNLMTWDVPTRTSKQIFYRWQKLFPKEGRLFEALQQRVPHVSKSIHP